MHQHRNHTSSERSEEQRLRWALLFTIGIMLAEIAGGFLSGSLALLADAGHMFVDGVALFLSYLAIRIGQRPGGGQYTYGFRRVEVLVALFNGLTLLILCSSITYEAFQRLIKPEQIDVPLMIAVAVIGISANIASAALLRNARSLNVRSAFLHVLGDLFSSIAIVLGGMVMWIWGIPWLDPALSVMIAIIVLISAYRLISEAITVLMEAAPGHLDTGEIRLAILRLDYLADVHDLHVWTITSGLPALSCHAVLKPGVEDTSDRALQDISTLLRQEFDIRHVTVQVESASYRIDQDNECERC